MKVTVVLSVFQAWREGYFSRLQIRHPVKLTVIHGSGVTGTKLRNAPATPNVHRVQLTQWTLATKITGRPAHVYLFKGLLRQFRKTSPDVVLLEGGSNLLNNFFVLLWCWMRRIPVVWWTLGEIPGRKYSIVGRIFRKLVAFLELRCDAMLLYSSVALAYAKRIGVPDEKCFVATNVVDTEKCAERAIKLRGNRHQLRNELFGDDHPIVVFVGALAEGKYLDRLPNIFSIVISKIPKARLLIIGDGPLMSSLKQEIAERNLSDSTFFAGDQRDQLSKYLVAGDVFLLPGLGGLAISEAMAHGLPVVCAQGDGTEVDLVINGETGCRLETNSKDDINVLLANSVVDLLADADLRKMYSENSIALVTQKFTGTNMVNQIFNALEHAHNQRK